MTEVIQKLFQAWIAESVGESMNAFLSRAITQTMKRDNTATGEG